MFFLPWKGLYKKDSSMLACIGASIAIYTPRRLALAFRVALGAYRAGNSWIWTAFSSNHMSSGSIKYNHQLVLSKFVAFYPLATLFD